MEVGVGIGFIIDDPAVAERGFDTEILEVGLVIIIVIALERLRNRITVEAVFWAELRDLRRCRAAERVNVVAKEGENGAVAGRNLDFTKVVRAPGRSVTDGAATQLALEIEHGAGAVELVERAAVELEAAELRTVAAEGGVGVDANRVGR